MIKNFVLFVLFCIFTNQLYSQTDTMNVSQDTTVIPLGEKFDTVSFIGVVLENPLTVKDYRQIVKSRYFMVGGKPQQQYLDSWIEVRRRKGWSKTKLLPENFMFTKQN